MTEINNLLNQESEIDKEIIKLIKKRRELSERIEEVKIKQKLPMNDSERTRAVLKNVMGTSGGVESEFVEKFYTEIIDYCGE